MQQPILSSLRLAPALFASALLAVTSACSITITEPEPNGCPALDELCPNLACDDGNVVVDGCPICECAAPPACSDAEAPPPGCRYDADCSVVCDPVVCSSDDECGEGFYCAFFGPEPEPGSGDAAQRPLTGTCEPLVVEPGCTSDIDCGEGYYCSFDGASPPSGGSGDALVAAGECVKLEETCTADIDCVVGSLCENGVCVENNECFADEDCREGYHCESLDAAGALIALPGGVCVADNEGCASDADCNGGTCVTTCESDPNCPECDVCLFVSTCVDTGCTVNADCDEGEVCFFGDPAAGDRAIVCPDENNDGQCDFDVPAGGVCRTVPTEVECTANADCGAGQFCDFDTNADRIAPPPCVDNDNDGICDEDVIVIQTGVCRDLEGTCGSDADCAAGEVCQFDEGCACPDVCIDDGNGGCLPCECPAFTGICVVPVDPSCTSDADCRDGQICSFFDARPAPCLDADNDGVCDFEVPVLGVCTDDPTPPTTCSTDADCENGEFCSFGDTPADAQGILPPAGICVPLILDPCAAVLCEEGTSCVVDENGGATCIADPDPTCTVDADCPDASACINGVCSAPR